MKVDSYFTNNCPNCSGHLTVSLLKCGDCGLRVEGEIRLPRLAQLAPDLREFAELYLVTGGSLKQVSANLYES